MRIAHVITRLIVGGAQENTVLCCEDLMRQYGDDVLLIAGPPLGPEGSLLERGRAGGLPIEVVPALRRPVQPWRDWLSYRRIKEALRRFRPDVVHTHSAKGGILGRAAAWSLGVPAIVHTVHGAPFYAEQGRGARAAARACERWAARRCHALVCVADAMTDLIVEAGVAPREKCTTIYSGMEVEPFLQCGVHRGRVRQELGYRPEHVVVGKIARLFHLKGHADVIRAARLVVDRQPDVRFLFVGDGILRADLERQIAAAGLREHFQLLGLVPPERIPGLLAAMDILVHASLREGLARALPQALIAGKPVVSYDIHGAREVVIPGQTGYLVPTHAVGEVANLPQDVGQVANLPERGSASRMPATLADAMSRLAADPALRERLGTEGRRRFTDQFRHERMTAQIRALYQSTLETNPQPRY